MNTREYKSLRDRLETEYKKKLAVLEEEHKQNLIALDRIWQTVREDHQSEPVMKAASYPPVRTLQAAVQSVLSEVQGNFEINTIIAIIEQKHPEIKMPINPTSVSGILRRLKEEGRIEMVKQGAGKRPSIYKLPKKAIKA